MKKASIQLTSKDGQPLNVSGCILSLVPWNGVAPVIAGEIVDGPAGVVEFDPSGLAGKVTLMLIDREGKRHILGHGELAT